jgi:hypothetical protein
MRSLLLVCALSVAGALCALPTLASAKPPGFVEVTSPDLFGQAGAQSHGTVDCPAGTVPLGGGVIARVSSDQTINSSYPTATGWAADVNNPTALDSIFQLTVECGLRPRGYQVVASPSTLVPAGGNASTSAFCPGTSKALGGGVFSNSGLLSVNLADSFPSKGAFTGTITDASTLDSSMTVFAVCGKLKGYDLVRAPVLTLPPGQLIGGVSCPFPEVATGGGVLTSFTDPRVAITASFFEAGGWGTDLLNHTEGDVRYQSFAVCFS